MIADFIHSVDVGDSVAVAAVCCALTGVAIALVLTVVSVCMVGRETEQ